MKTRITNYRVLNCQTIVGDSIIELEIEQYRFWRKNKTYTQIIYVAKEDLMNRLTELQENRGVWR